jgi:hypothetical protein
VSGPRETYQQRRARFGAERAQRAAELRRLGWLRVFTFALAALLAWWGGGAGATGPARWLPALAAAAAFAYLVRRHGRARDAEREVAALERVNADAEHRLLREWAELPAPPDISVPGDHPYAADLDVFGVASLWQLFPAVTAAPARQTLSRWLLAPAEPAEVLERQTAVAELSDQLDFRDALAVLAGRVGEVRPQELERFMRWDAGEAWLTGRPVLTWAAWLVPAATAAAILGARAGVADSALWVAPVALALLVTAVTARRVRRTYDRVTARASALAGYARLFERLTAASFGAPLLRRLQGELSAGGKPAHARLRELERLVRLSELRLSPLMYGPVQLLTLWDLHVVRGLDRWVREGGVEARRWFAALGELESLAAMAALRHAHPAWCMAELAGSDPPELSARLLGHPLLADAVRVPNDVTVGPPGTVLLVTGSNMAGKSTLLRAVGLNAVLAQMGAPACAASLRLAPVAVFTSMRVTDSLAAGVSFFMAELRRLKQLVDAAHRADGRTELYLLDELLQGTNTAERQVAARTVIGHLLAAGAIGMVTTHDLALANAPDLAGAARPVHFSETVGGEPGAMTMTFDYQLRPGVATSVNALRLMELVGLGAPVPR